MNCKTPTRGGIARNPGDCGASRKQAEFFHRRQSAAAHDLARRHSGCETDPPTQCSRRHRRRHQRRLDEDTAAFIGPDETIEVEGSGGVTVVDASDVSYSSIGEISEG